MITSKNYLVHLRYSFGYCKGHNPNNLLVADAIIFDDVSEVMVV